MLNVPHNHVTYPSNPGALVVPVRIMPRCPPRRPEGGVEQSVLFQVVHMKHH